MVANTPELESSAVVSSPDTLPADRNRVSEAAVDGGVTWRVVALSLALAVFFGFIIPVIDVKLANTFLGAQHLPPGAIGVLLVMILVVNPLSRLAVAKSGMRVAFLASTAFFTAAAWWLNGTAGRGSFSFWAATVLAVLSFIGFMFGSRPLSRNETLTVYITCLFSCLVPGHGAENFFVSNLVGPFYYSTAENQWLNWLEPYLKPWLTPALWADQTGQYGPAGRALVENWYIGGAKAIPWDAWLVPLCVWGALCVLVYIMLGCFAVMLRAQWGENEALSFPLLRLPLELTEDLDRTDKYGWFSRFFRNPLTWIGVGLAVALQSLNGLNFYFPDVPLIATDVNTGPMLSEPPWNQIGWTPLQIYPIAIGLAFLLTSEVGFSLWFFYWFIKIQFILAYYLGFMPNTLPNAVGGGGKIFTSYQVVGATIAFAAIVMWTGRAHYWFVTQRAFGRAKKSEAEASEMMSYPVAFWGFVLSSAAILGWSVAAGVRLDVAVVMWSLYMVTAISLTRVLAEGGLLYVGNSFRPLATVAQLTNAGPNTWLPPNVIAPASLIQGGFMTDMRGFLLPSFVHGFKLAHDQKISRRPLLALIVAVILITFVMGLWMRVRLGYETGALGFHTFFAKSGAQIPGSTTKSLSAGVADVSWLNWFWLGFGGGLTWLLMILRARLLWFPLHPMGYVIALTYPIMTLWFSIMAGWLCKVLITRFGGSETYRKTIPLFLGLALGDVIMMLVWLIVDGWQGRTYHYLVPT